MIANPVYVDCSYNPRKHYEENRELRLVCDMIRDGYFNRENPDLFKSIYDNIVNHDFYMLCADYEEYIKAQDRVARHYAVSKFIKSSIFGTNAREIAILSELSCFTFFVYRAFVYLP